MHRWPLCVVILLLAGTFPACNVERAKTPHEKELAARRQARRLLDDAGTVSARPRAKGKARPVAPAVARERRVVIAMDAEPKHLNPLLEISRWGYRISMHNVFESLLRRDPITGKSPRKRFRGQPDQRGPAPPRGGEGPLR